MDHPLFDLIERRIREAEDAGDFEGLSGAGKPLPRYDDPTNAVFGRIVRESGAVPEFVALSRELAKMREELQETGDRTKRSEILKVMSMMDARIELAKKAGR